MTELSSFAKRVSYHSRTSFHDFFTCANCPQNYKRRAKVEAAVVNSETTRSVEKSTVYDQSKYLQLAEYSVLPVDSKAEDICNKGLLIN